MNIIGFVGILIAVGAAVPVALALAGRLVMGKNGYSLAKLQLLLWTAVIAASYVVYLWQLQRQPEASFDIVVSHNLLVLMGLSAGSFVAASGIRAYQQQKGQVVARTDGERAKWVTLISDNSGNLDLSKVQMLAWTLVSLCAYVIQLAHDLPRLDYQQPALPNVSEMLVALMGVSQAAYIGRKAVPESAPGPSQPAQPAPPVQPAPPGPPPQPAPGAPG